MYAVGQARLWNVLTALAPPLLIIFSAIARASGTWPIKAYSSQWWQVVFLAFLIAILGAYRRRRADDALEQLEDLRRSRRMGTRPS